MLKRSSLEILVVSVKVQQVKKTANYEFIVAWLWESFVDIHVWGVFASYKEWSVREMVMWYLNMYLKIKVYLQNSPLSHCNTSVHFQHCKKTNSLYSINILHIWLSHHFSNSSLLRLIIICWKRINKLFFMTFVCFFLLIVIVM